MSSRNRTPSQFVIPEPHSFSICHPGRPSEARSIRDPEAGQSLPGSRVSARDDKRGLDPGSPPGTTGRRKANSQKALVVPHSIHVIPKPHSFSNMSSRKTERGEVYPGSRSRLVFTWVPGLRPGRQERVGSRLRSRDDKRGLDPDSEAGTARKI